MELKGLQRVVGGERGVGEGREGLGRKVGEGGGGEGGGWLEEGYALAFGEGEGKGLMEVGFGVVEGFFLFLFLFLFGGRRGFGGEGVQETVESRLSDVGERGEDGKGVVNGRERWGNRGGRVEDVRGGRFWEGNFGVVDGGEMGGGFPPSCFLDFFGSSGGSSGGRYSSLSGERGEEGGRWERKGYKVGGEKKGEIGMRELSLEKRGEERE